MTCIILDDEPLARTEMEILVKEVSELEVVAKFQNAVTALDFLKTNKVDIVFLDIEMPMISGLSFAEQLPQETLIIFTTAYPQYALKSYELDAVDYLLKPIDKSRLEKAVKKAMAFRSLFTEDISNNTLASNTADFLIIRADRRFHKISFEDILFIEGLKDYVVIVTKKCKHIVAMNLKTIHQKVPQERFLRISKSYVVNKIHIESFDNNNIYINEFEIPIGEVFKKEFIINFTNGSLDSLL